MSTPVYCSNCGTALHQPPVDGFIRCSLCQICTHIGQRQPPPQPQPQPQHHLSDYPSPHYTDYPPRLASRMPHPQWNIPSYNPSPSAYTVPPQSQYTPPPRHLSHYPSPQYTHYPPPLTHTMPHPQWNIPSYNPSPSAYTGPLQSQYTPPPHHHSHYPSPYYTPYPPPLTHTMPHRQWNIPSYNPSPSADSVPLQSQYAPPPAPAQGRKKAVICGISYKHSKNPILGSINDAKNMKQLLIDKFQFSESSIVMLTEEETNRNRLPTKYNMLSKLEWLVQDCKPGDSLLFYYSGHGSQMEYFNSDEVDGRDEALCPLDHETEGRIVDDDINKIIVRPLPRGVKLHAIIDACHSATVLDLPFLYRKNMSTGQYLWEDHRPGSGEWKGSYGEVICFSGCDDHQKSFDGQLPSKNTHSGVMTSCFIETIKSGHATTYGHILDSLRHSIATVGCSNGWPRRQEPQLTASQIFEVYAKPFSL